MTQQTLPITVSAGDINRIGIASYDENGNTVIVCKYDISGLEIMFLRTILKCFGDYSITRIFSADNEDFDQHVCTDLPWSIYTATPDPLEPIYE